MDKNVELVSENVVILANQFNLSIMNQHWLIENCIILQDDLQDGYTFTPVFTQVKTKPFLLTIVPERLQIDLYSTTKNKIGLIKSKLGTIVDKLPHTPFAALGFNFAYFLTTEDSRVEKYTRSLFFKPDSPLSSQFDEDNAKFGGYFSKDVSGFRHKLDIKPVSIKSEYKTIDKIKLDFNFHLDLVGNNKSKTILKYLAKWDNMESITKDIVNLIK
jgi:hypothetical protein